MAAVLVPMYGEGHLTVLSKTIERGVAASALVVPPAVSATPRTHVYRRPRQGSLRPQFVPFQTDSRPIENRDRPVGHPTMAMEGFGDDDVQELRGLVMSTLEQQGALAKIRASLRAAVFCAIHEQGGPGVITNHPTSKLLLLQNQTAA